MKGSQYYGIAMLFQSCKILLTTQKLLIHSEIRAKNCIDKKQMELDEAVKLLTATQMD